MSIHPSCVRRPARTSQAAPSRSSAVAFYDNRESGVGRTISGIHAVGERAAVSVSTWHHGDVRGRSLLIFCEDEPIVSAAIKVATESRLYGKRGPAVAMTPGRSGMYLTVHTRRDDRGPVIGFQLTRPTGEEEVGAPIMIWGDQFVALGRALDWLAHP